MLQRCGVGVGLYRVGCTLKGINAVRTMVRGTHPTCNDESLIDERGRIPFMNADRNP